MTGENMVVRKTKDARTESDGEKDLKQRTIRLRKRTENTASIDEKRGSTTTHLRLQHPLTVFVSFLSLNYLCVG